MNPATTYNPPTKNPMKTTGNGSWNDYSTKFLLFGDDTNVSITYFNTVRTSYAFTLPDFLKEFQYRYKFDGSTGRIESRLSLYWKGKPTFSPPKQGQGGELWDFINSGSDTAPAGFPTNWIVYNATLTFKKVATYATKKIKRDESGSNARTVVSENALGVSVRTVKEVIPENKQHLVDVTFQVAGQIVEIKDNASATLSGSSFLMYAGEYEFVSIAVNIQPIMGTSAGQHSQTKLAMSFETEPVGDLNYILRSDGLIDNVINFTYDTDNPYVRQTTTSISDFPPQYTRVYNVQEVEKGGALVKVLRFDTGPLTTTECINNLSAATELVDSDYIRWEGVYAGGSTNLSGIGLQRSIRVARTRIDPDTQLRVMTCEPFRIAKYYDELHGDEIVDSIANFLCTYGYKPVSADKYGGSKYTLKDPLDITFNKDTPLVKVVPNDGIAFTNTSHPDVASDTTINNRLITCQNPEDAEVYKKKFKWRPTIVLDGGNILEELRLIKDAIHIKSETAKSEIENITLQTELGVGKSGSEAHPWTGPDINKIGKMTPFNPAEHLKLRIGPADIDDAFDLDRDIAEYSKERYNAFEIGDGEPNKSERFIGPQSLTRTSTS